MAFPDPRVEIQVGSTWTDITADVFTKRQTLTISRGRADEAARADPARCQLGLNNRDGRYSPRNPTSPYYGLIGRNTPLRVSVPGSTRLVLDGTPSGVVSTPDAAALDITGDLDLRAEADIEWHSGANQVLLGKWGSTSSQRSYALRVLDGQVQISWSADGLAGLFLAAPLPPTARGRMAVRAVLDVDNGSGGYTATFYSAPSLAGPWTQLGTPVIGGGTTSVFSGTAPLLVGSPDPATTPPRVPPTGALYRAEVRSGIGGTVVAAPDFTAQTPGATGFTDSAGRIWTLAGTAEITDRRVRFIGEVSAWPSRWGVSGQDVWVPLEASGITRRLGQGVKPLDSTLRRRIPSEPALLAYWPLEEAGEATQAYSPIAGVQPMVVDNIEFASDDSLPGSSALPKIGTTSSFGVQVPPGPDGAWRVECVYKISAFPATPTVLLEVHTTGGTYDRLQLEARPGDIRLYGIEVSGSTSSSTLLLNSAGIIFTGRWNRLQIRAETVGGDTTFHVNYITIGVQEKGISATWADVTAGHVTAVSSAPGAGLDQVDLHLGHLSVMSVVRSTIYDRADEGFAGDTAWQRIWRLGKEEGVPVVLSGVPTDTMALGPQRPQTLLDLVQEAADADGGIAGEQRDQVGLRYRARTTLYSQGPALELDYEGPGLAPPLDPTDDDAEVRNDVTVSRIGGSAARAVLQEGPLSVQPPPAGVGKYDESVQLSLQTDPQVEPIAWWRLWLGTQDAIRYPSVHVDLAKAPQLIDAATGLVEGDRITIAHPPPWLPPEMIDLIAQGYTETIRPYKWDLVFNCSPACPWNVGIAGGDVQTITEDFEDTTYAVTITDSGTLPWTRTNTQAHGGSWSLRSGAISNNQTSDAIVSVPSGATSLSFWYRVSSEPSGTGFEGDRLLVLRDGVQQLRAQGTVGWTQYTLDVTGATAITFRYVKDNSSASGEDAAYIDDLVVTIPPTVLGYLADADGAELAADVDADDTALSVAVTAGPLWSTDTAYLPVDLVLGGELVTVTAITGTSSPQTFTVVRSVNGIAKAHSTGSAVTLSHPAISAL